MALYLAMFERIDKYTKDQLRKDRCDSGKSTMKWMINLTKIWKVFYK